MPLRFSFPRCFGPQAWPAFATFVISALTATTAHCADAAAESLPPIRAITKGPRFHWFGYYDKHQFDTTDRYVLGNEVAFEHRSPAAENAIRVGMVDLADGDRWIELGRTRAWNWQQGCMLQWLPGDESTVVWNDREDAPSDDGKDAKNAKNANEKQGRFVCHVLDVKTGKRRTIEHPIYTVSPDGRWALSCDFRRLNDCRPGYGYAGIADPNADVFAPADSGIWKVDMKTGEAKLIVSLADAARIDYTGGFARGAKHWFNHLLISPDGKRFIFLHRWRGDGERGFSTRMFTADADGDNLYVLDPHGRTSHFIWRDGEHVAAWAWHPSHKDRFYLFKDRTDEVEPIGPEVMTLNGHNTYVPHTDNAWILNDTYPDVKRLQHPYLFHVPTSRRVPLGHFHSPTEYQGEWRCDTHPRSSRSGKFVCIDSPHDGGRQLYLIDVSGIVGAKR